MATIDPPTPASRPVKHLNTTILLGILALLAPLSYAAGRISVVALTHTYVEFIATGIANGALGVMIGIPIGLFFGSLRHRNTHVVAPNSRAKERTILEEISRELSEDMALFEARKGSTLMFARIAYVAAFWNSIKASGQLFVMQDARLLSTLATAYYWLDQATRLEALAYEAKYARPEQGDHGVAEHLIIEARLFDGQIETSLRAALDAISTDLART